MRETTATPNIDIRKGKDADQSDTSRYTYIRHTQIQISFLRQWGNTQSQLPNFLVYRRLTQHTPMITNITGSQKPIM